MKQHDKPATPTGSDKQRIHPTDKKTGQEQEMSKHLGRVNDQARDGKERRTHSPHNR